MKKLTRIAMIAFALVVTLMVSIVFAACGSKTVTLSQSDGAAVVTAAAENFQNKHVDYSNYENTTTTMHVDMNSVDKSETFNLTGDYVFTIKNVGDKVHLKIDAVVKMVTKTKTTTTEHNIALNYLLASKQVDDQFYYYETVNADVDGETERQYYKFTSDKNYINSVNSYLTMMNNLIEKTYFVAFSEESEMPFDSPTYSQKGDKVEMKLEASKPMVSNGVTTSVSGNYTVSFVKNEIDAVSMKVQESSSAGSSHDVNVTIKTKASAENVNLPDLAGYEVSSRMIGADSILDLDFDDLF